MRQPFYRSQTNSWYVHHNGKQVRLGKDRDAAFAAWHALEQNAPTKTDGATVQYVIGEFLEWTKARREPSTYEWYRHYLAGNDKRPRHAFGGFVGPSKRVSDLRPLDLERWLERELKHASENGLRGAFRAVMRCFAWAAKKKLINENPLTGAECLYGTRTATYQPKHRYLTPDQWDKLIGSIKPTDWLHDYLTFLRATGCRPHEARIAEKRHFVPELKVLVFPKDEAKGKKRERVIPLTDTAFAIVQRLALKNPAGAIFRNRVGKPLSKDMIHGRLHTLSRRLGFSVCAYDLRKSFVTDAMVRGVSADALAHATGHVDTTMIHTVYSHLAARADFLRQVAQQATGEVA
jgi:integrase